MPVQIKPGSRFSLVFIWLDRLSVLLAAACVLITVLPGGDISLPGGFIIRLVGIKNPLVACLAIIVFLQPIRRQRSPILVGSVRWMLARAGTRFRPIVVVVVSVVFLQAVFYRASASIDGDGLAYYAFLRSFALQGDLDFADEFADYTFGSTALPDPREKTATGLTGNPYSIGPAILWSPFFFAGQMIAGWRGERLDGYSASVIECVVLGTSVYALAGLGLTIALLRFLSPSSRIVAVVAGMWFASPMIEYFRVEGSMSHAHSLFAVTLFLYLHFRSAGRRSPAGWFALGAAGGLMFLVRWQDATFCLLALADLVRGKRLHKTLADGTLYAAGFILVALPQILVFKVLYGGWLTVPQGRDFIGLVPKYVWQVLVSTNHGLLLWHPLTAIAVGGLVWGTLVRRKYCGTLLAGFLLQLLVNASISQWWAGHAFGGRRFMGCFALMAAGVAVVSEHPLLKGWRLSALLVALGALNYLLWYSWITAGLPHEGALDVGQIISAIAEAARQVDPKSVVILALLATAVRLAALQDPGRVALGAAPR